MRSKFSVIQDYFFWVAIVLFLIGFFYPDEPSTTAKWFLGGAVCMFVAIIPWDQFKK